MKPEKEFKTPHCINMARPTRNFFGCTDLSRIGQKKKFSELRSAPMSLPPAPPEEGTSREKKLQKNKEQKEIFFLHTAS